MNIVQKHKLAGIGSILMILVFQGVTILTEILGTGQSILMAKRLVAVLIPVLVAFLIVVRFTGIKLLGSRSDELAQLKQRNMKLIASNGMLVLLPSALVLLYLAENKNFNWLFWLIQLVEILAGWINLFLLIQNARAGLRMKQLRLSSKFLMLGLFVGFIFLFWNRLL